ncbi:DsbA family protein [Streptomyces sp. NPDC056178]|uniref:DsbA family protein n=1 Tax=unclassified Streptomyces TaxID=2593676 RepID=UPI0035DAC380
MRIEVVVVQDCPNEQLAAGRLRQALEAAGLQAADVVTRVVTNRAEAERIGFTGSPTILINGEDPFAEAGRAQGMTCRLYRTPEGSDGAPSVSRLQQALTTASHHS